MSKPVYYDAADRETVPSAMKLAEMAHFVPCLIVRYPSLFVRTQGTYTMTWKDLADDFRENLIAELRLLLPDHVVTSSERMAEIGNTVRWNDKPWPEGFQMSGTVMLWMRRVISEEVVLANADMIVAAALQFRELATHLATQMAVRLNVPLIAFANPAFRLEFDPSGNNPVMELDHAWTFWFHGYECLFKNRRTGQRVEMRFGFANEFGVLDPYFFYQFLDTTAELEVVARLFEDDYLDPKRAMEILERCGRLKRVTASYSELSGLVAFPE